MTEIGIGWFIKEMCSQCDEFVAGRKHCNQDMRTCIEAEKLRQLIDLTYAQQCDPHVKVELLDKD